MEGLIFLAMAYFAAFAYSLAWNYQVLTISSKFKYLLTKILGCFYCMILLAWCHCVPTLNSPPPPLAIVITASYCFIDYITNCSLHTQSSWSWLGRSLRWLDWGRSWNISFFFFPLWSDLIKDLIDGASGRVYLSPSGRYTLHLIIDHWSWPSICPVPPAYQCSLLILD